MLTVDTNKTSFWLAIERLNGKQKLAIYAILQNPPNVYFEELVQMLS